MPAADPSVSGVPRVERIESALRARAIRPSGGDRAIRDERSAGVDFARRHRWRSVSASLRAIGHHAAARKPMFRERHDHCSHSESCSKTRYLTRSGNRERSWTDKCFQKSVNTREEVRVGAGARVARRTHGGRSVRKGGAPAARPRLTGKLVADKFFRAREKNLWLGNSIEPAYWNPSLNTPSSW